MTVLRRLHGATSRTAAILLAVLLVLGVGAGIVVELVRTPQWQASTDALIRTWSVESLLLTGQPTPVETEDQADAAVVAVSQTVLSRAAEALDEPGGWTELAERVTAVPVPTSHFVTITATGRDEQTAVRTSEAVATAFAQVMRENLTAAADGLVSTQTGEGDPDIRLRTQLLTWTLQPIQVYRTSQPEQLVPSAQTPVALGVVGLAIGALVILAMTLLRPSVTGARDAQRLLALPAVGFGPGGEPETARLIARLLEVNPKGALMVAPVTADAEKAGLQLVEWIRQRSDDTDRVQLVAEPTGAVLAAKPRRADVAALVLVVPEGTLRQDVSDAVALLSPWRAVDAVVVTA